MFVRATAIALLLIAQSPSPRPEPKPPLMPVRVGGTFEVKMVEQKPDNDVAKEASVGRFSLEKRYSGPLEGVGKGEMLGVEGDPKTSAGYVAIERFTGTLSGRKGSFVLQHLGTLDRGKPSLYVYVVPDSGTGELKGLAGWMNIVVQGRQHTYEFNYTLSATEKK